MGIIYELEGRAGEYTEKYAANFFNGCSHGCIYCFAPNVLKMKRDEFYNNPKLKRPNTIIEEFIKNLEKLKDKKEIFLSFSCDPYQPIEAETEVTREAIFQMCQREQPFSILTKGGKRSERDFDLLAEHPELCKYGVTFVFAKDDDCLKYEPGAAPTSERIEVLRKAHEMGIKTWVSLEPVWSKDDVCKLILDCHEWADEIKIGKLNYHPHAKEVNWKEIKEAVTGIFESLGVNYSLKKDLEAF